MYFLTCTLTAEVCQDVRHTLAGEVAAMPGNRTDSRSMAGHRTDHNTRIVGLSFLPFRRFFCVTVATGIAISAREGSGAERAPVLSQLMPTHPTAHKF